MQPEPKLVVPSLVERHQKPEVRWWEVQDELSVELPVASERVRLLARARWLDTRLCSGLLDGEARTKVRVATQLLSTVKVHQVLKVEE